MNFLIAFLILIQLCAPKTDEEYVQILMEDDCFEVLSKIGYSGNPTREKLKNRQNLIK